MRALVQRVTSASVAVGDEVVGAIGAGLCVLVGVGTDDTAEHARWVADKVADLRVLRDPVAPERTMERSLVDTGGEALVISQFTLQGDARRGRRPSWGGAARPEHAEPLVDAVVERLRELGVPTATGVFGADMRVALVNDGPVTVLLER